MAAYFNSSANRRSTASLSSSSSTGGSGTSPIATSAMSIPHSPSAPPTVSFSSILLAENEEDDELSTRLITSAAGQ